MKVNFHTIEFMSAEADMGCKFENKFSNFEISARRGGHGV